MKIDNYGRITIPSDIWPTKDFLKSDVAVYYSPKENSLGIIPKSKVSEDIRLMGIVTPDSQGRLCITRFLSAISSKPGDDNIIAYIFKGVVYLRKP